MANIVRTEPYGEVARFDPFRDLEDLFGARRWRSMMRDLPEEPTIRMDVSENGEGYRVKAEIPGVHKEDIRVAVDGNVVTISAESRREKEEKKGDTLLRTERYYGKQSRSFTLRHDIESGKAEAKYQDGILDLMLPKKGGMAPKVLPIQ